MAGSIITTGSHRRALLGGIFTMFGDDYNQLDAKHAEVYKRKKSKKNFEEAIQLIGMGQAEEKEQGQPVQISGIKQGHARLTYHKVWSKGAKITMEAFEDNLHMDMAREISRNLARALWHAKESNAAKLFNNATSTSAPYLGADGKAFLANDHPLGGGGTLDNLIGSDLSELAIEDAIIQMKGWKDNGGLLINANPKALLIPKENKYVAHRILQSNLRSGTADNDANALKDMGEIPKVIVWNFLTDTDSWFILTDVPGLCYYDRDGVKARDFMEDLTYDHVYTISERYSFDHYDPRSCIGSVGE